MKCKLKTSNIEHQNVIVKNGFKKKATLILKVYLQNVYQLHFYTTLHKNILLPAAIELDHLCNTKAHTSLQSANVFYSQTRPFRTFKVYFRRVWWQVLQLR